MTQVTQLLLPDYFLLKPSLQTKSISRSNTMKKDSSPHPARAFAKTGSGPVLNLQALPKPGLVPSRAKEAAMARKICSQLQTHNRYHESQVGRDLAYDVVAARENGFVLIALLTDADASNAEAIVSPVIADRLPVIIQRGTWLTWTNPFRNPQIIPVELLDKFGRTDLRTAIVHAREFVRRSAVQDGRLVPPR